MPREDRPAILDLIKPIEELDDQQRQDVHDMMNGEGRFSPTKRQSDGGLKAKSVANLIAFAKKKCQQLCVYSAVEDFGIVRCVTCPETGVYNSSGMHGGHYIHSGPGNYTTALYMENLNVQCMKCNTWENARKEAYKEYLGEWMVNWLEEEAKKPNPWDAETVAIYLVTHINPGLKEAKAKIKRMTQMVHTHGARTI